MKALSAIVVRRARSSRMAVLCLACALLGGCILKPMGPNYKRPEVPLPTAWRVEPVQPAEAVEITNTSWWRGFGDDHLDEFIEQALRANYDILIATARVEEFAGKLQSVNSHYFPEFGGHVGFERDQRSEEVPEILPPGQPVTFNQYKAFLTTSYEFDLWGRVRRSYEASKAQLLSTGQARHTVMLTVVTSVAATYIELLVADRELEVAQQTLDNMKQIWDLTVVKYHGGSATDIQVGEAQAEYEDQAAVIPTLKREIAVLEDSLSTLLGRNPGPISRGRLDKLALMAVPSDIPSTILTRRPDVRAAEQDLVAANASIGIALTEYFPTFSLTGSYGQSSDMTQWMLAQTARTGNLFIDLVGPLYTFGRVEGDVARARADTKAQTDRYLLTVQTALREVDDALVSNEQTRLRVEALKRYLSSRQSVAATTKVRYEGGSSTDLDVMRAQQRVFNAENEETEGERNEFLALVAVFKALGGGWMTEQDKVLLPIPKKHAVASAAPKTAQPAATTSK
jgi:outer membrane protein, multidrug efflux system